MNTQSLYVIQSEAGPLKVGISRQPADRMAELQKRSAATLSLVHVEVVEHLDVRRVEQAAHELLKAARMHGEWFNTEVELAVQAIRDAIEQVRNMADAAEMSPDEFNAALQQLSLTPYGAAPLLGVSLRTSHRYASGEQPVNRTVARLLTMYVRYGLPADWR